MNKTPTPLWFKITLLDCNGQELAMWWYDERYPVTAPQFSYSNDSDRCRYLLRIMHLAVYQEVLPTGNLNVVISHMVNQYAQKFREMMLNE